jgi:hypothetical protein
MADFLQALYHDGYDLGESYSLDPASWRVMASQWRNEPTADEHEILEKISRDS